VDGVKNYNIAVKKRGDEITFLRRIIRGGADGSYGIEVAKLAGVPHSVVSRAKIILKELEDADTNKPVRFGAVTAHETEEMQFSFSSNAGSAIVEKLKALDVNTITPIEAMGMLYDLVREAGNI